MNIEFYITDIQYLGTNIITDSEKHQYYKINNNELCILHVIIKEYDIILKFFSRENKDLTLEFSFTIQKNNKSGKFQKLLDYINNVIDIIYIEQSIDVILKNIRTKEKIKKLLLIDYINYSKHLYDEILKYIKNITNKEVIKYLFYLIDIIDEQNNIMKNINIKEDFFDKYKIIIGEEITEALESTDIKHIKTYKSILRKKKINKLLK